MIPSRVVMVLFQAGYSIRFLARLFGETELGMQELLRREMKRRAAHPEEARR